VHTSPRIGSWLLRAALVLVGVAAGLWLYGLGAGGGFYHKLVRAPLAPAIEAPYYRESLLHVGLAHLIGVTTILQFRLFVLGFYWAALAWWTTAAHRRLTLTDTVIVWLVLLTHPSAMIVHTWTCHPDALLYLLGTMLPFARSPWIVALLAALAAWTNLPMALVVCLSTALLWFAFADDRARPRTIALLLGLAAGAATCKATLFLADVHLARDRFAAAVHHDPRALLHHWQGPGWPIVYTLHFAHLLWLPALVLTLYPHHRRAALALVASQMLALGAAFLAEDTTRIFAVLAWSPLAYCLLRALQLAGRDRFRLRLLVCLGVVVTLLAPKFFAWKGQLHDLEGARAHLRRLVSAERPSG
jgi:hypothetical protein